jgi:hypothetical protein
MASSKPWVQRIETLIADGPVEVNTLIAQAGGLVPPGLAWRTREWHRKYAAKRKGFEAPEESIITDEAIWTGQRHVIRDSIGKLVWAKRARYLEQDGVKYLERQTPPKKDRSAVNRATWDEASDEQRTAWLTGSIMAPHLMTPEARATRVRRSWLTRKRSKPSL